MDAYGCVLMVMACKVSFKCLKYFKNGGCGDEGDGICLCPKAGAVLDFFKKKCVRSLTNFLSFFL